MSKARECNVCGGPISKTATRCPRCGDVTGRGFVAAGCMWLALGVMAVGVFMLVVALV